MSPIAECPSNGEHETSVIIEASNKALEAVIDGLGIPDKDDREYRVIKSEDSKTVTIAYTTGPDEYGNGPFYPSPETVRTTGKRVLDIYAGLGVDTVEMQAWSNSAFILRNPEDKESREIPSLENVGGKIEELKISLALSPQAISATAISPSTKERPRPQTREVFETVGNELSSSIREKINLPEKVTVEISTLNCLAAETDITADIDISTTEGEKISPEEMQSLAGAIMNYLNNDPSTETGIATVWVRQGQPEIISISSNPSESQF